MKRSKAVDRALCLHEAGHAVIAEILSPGRVIGIEMDYVLGTPSLGGDVYAENCEAVCSWHPWEWSDVNTHTAIAAARYAEEIDPNPNGYHWQRDEDMIRQYCPPWRRAAVRRRAKALVRKHELAIRRVAKALAERRVMTGDEIREAAWL